MKETFLMQYWQSLLDSTDLQNPEDTMLSNIKLSIISGFDEEILNNHCNIQNTVVQSLEIH